MKNLFKLVLLMTVVALLAHLWVTPPERLLEAARSAAGEDTPKADSFMRESVTRRFDENGTLTYRLNARLTTFYSDANRYQLQEPEMEMIADNRSRHRARSRTGTVLDGGTLVRLEDDVVIWQEEPATLSYQLETPVLLLYPEQRLAKSDQAVKLLFGQSVTKGTGLRADINEQRFEILSNVKSVHQPL